MTDKSQPAWNPNGVVAIDPMVLADLIKLAATAPAYADRGEQWAVRAIYEARGVFNRPADASAPSPRRAEGGDTTQ